MSLHRSSGSRHGPGKTSHTTANNPQKVARASEKAGFSRNPKQGGRKLTSKPFPANPGQ